MPLSHEERIACIERFWRHFPHGSVAQCIEFVDEYDKKSKPRNGGVNSVRTE